MEKDKVESRTEQEFQLFWRDNLELEEATARRMFNKYVRPSVPATFSKCAQCQTTMWKVRKNAIWSFEFCPYCVTTDKESDLVKRGVPAQGQGGFAIIQRCFSMFNPFHADAKCPWCKRDEPSYTQSESGLSVELDVIDTHDPKYHNKACEFIAAINALAALAASRSEEATPQKLDERDIPMCGGHAEAWFCERNHLKGNTDCVVCAFGAPAGSTEREKFVQEAVDYLKGMAKLYTRDGELTLGNTLSKVAIGIRSALLNEPHALAGTDTRCKEK